ncbi:berberine bridge enzyme-like 8 [Andrographis paniculata]|uniref:berberine bridge enzyme-like 8 n=1 Tax=Andrographis paniculata TaxID=175694 RepID=UPI0021E87A7E|nr:berberine bridge enzyme-like 8 [Andrographis paniculata]
MKMKMSSPRIAANIFASFFLFFIFLFLSVSSADSSSSSSHQAFIQCLRRNSDPSSPISAVLYSSDNSSYSSVLQQYIRNLRFNETTTPKPRLIITATHVSHIQASIVCAKRHRFLMKIRSGGHDYEAVSYTSQNPNFFVLDMFNFRKVNVSLEDETAWVGAGATLGEVYYGIAQKSNVHGYPAGVCPTVGVGGHISGGGYGNMMRKYGLTVDNVVDAEIVDVRGRILDRKSMGEDLFWAITGGGASSFGVALSYKIKLVRVPSVVTVFRVPRNYNQNLTDLVHRYQQVADKLPEDLFVRLTLSVVNGTNRGTFNSLFLGNSEQLLSIMNQSFPELGITRSDCTEMSWIQSVLFWTNLGQTSELLTRVPPTVDYLKRKSDFLQKPMPKEGIEMILQTMVELRTPQLTFNPMGGRMAEIPASEKPYPHRAGNIAKLQYATNWNETGVAAANRYLNLTRRLYDSMTPYVSMSPRQAFLNYRDLDIGINSNGPNSYQEGRVYGVKYFEGNFDRLVRIKTRVDPDNFFRNEQSIPVLP